MSSPAPLALARTFHASSSCASGGVNTSTGVVARCKPRLSLSDRMKDELESPPKPEETASSLTGQADGSQSDHLGRKRSARAGAVVVEISTFQVNK